MTECELNIFATPSVSIRKFFYINSNFFNSKNQVKNCITETTKIP